MPSKSKVKGNNNEYDVRDRLSAWLGKPFVKSPNSGALRWGNGIWTYGDLVPPEGFPFVCEAKHYETIVFDDILGRRTKKTKSNPDPQPSFGTGLVAEFWYEQTVPDAQRATRELGRPIEPLCVWKQDFHRMRLCVDEPLFRNLESSLRKELVCVWVYVPEKPPFMVVDLELFLRKVTPDALLKAFHKLHAFQEKFGS